MDTGLVLLRLVIGPLMAAHGAQKLFGWFGGYGLTGTGGFFEGWASVRAVSLPRRRQPPKLRAVFWSRSGSSARSGRR